MKVLVVNGANLNNLGKRGKIYGTITYEMLVDKISRRAKELGAAVSFAVSNFEGEIINALQNTDADAVIINAGAYSHYSYAIRDALEAMSIPKIEVHITNIFARESFRAVSVLSEVCNGVISGLGDDGYLLALEHIVRLLSK